MSVQISTTASTVSEPMILGANTYFWSAGCNASSRRRSEDRRQGEAAAYFEALGLCVTRSGDTVIADGAGLHIEFHYSESCHNVYKSLSITREGGKKSNITSLRKLAARIATA